MSEPVVIAIDGTSGSGKSTTARGVAARLGLGVLDTGAMYRAVTLAALEADVDPHDEPAVWRIAESVEISIEDLVVRLDGRVVTDEIRSADVDSAVSIVAAHPSVRELLVERQREWVRSHGGGVVEGRDIGTVVFPGAALKVYLVADDDVRAARRHQQDRAVGRPSSVDDVRSSLRRRDTLDSGRAVSPLAAAPDALVIDTSSTEVGVVVDEILEQLRSAP